MRKKSKILALILSTLLLTTYFCGCKDNNDPTINIGNSGTDKEDTKVENTIHGGSVTLTDDLIVSNRTSSYRIVTASDATQYAMQGAGYLSGYIYEATGANIPLVTNEGLTWSADAKWIVVGCPELFQQAGLTMPTNVDLGETGFYLKSKGKTLFIAGNADYALKNGCLELLQYLIDFEVYSYDTITYTKSDNLYFPDINVVERPDIDYLLYNNNVETSAVNLMRGILDADLWISVEGKSVHNTFKYFPKDKYFKDNADWYAVDGSQLCYTARGNEERLEQMINVAAEVMFKAVDANPAGNAVTITQEDVSSWCTCSACAAEKVKYGTDAAVLIKFCNRLGEKLDDYLTQQAQENGTPKRDVDVVFFAYVKTVTAPTKKVNGEHVPIDQSVVCRDNVGVYYAPIEAVFTSSLYDEVNVGLKETIEGWSVLTKNLYIWTYEPNYRYYMYPFNTFDSMVDNYRLFKECNAVYVMSQGVFDSGNATGFSRLKDYINYKASWNVNVNTREVINDWFNAYFEEAAVPMKKYFDEMQTHSDYMIEKYPAIYSGGIYCELEETCLWPRRTLEQWLGYIDDAYAVIAKFKESDPTKYERLYTHINLESMFMRYALIQLYSSYYTPSELKQMKESFIDDANILGITNYTEKGSISTVFKAWGY